MRFLALLAVAVVVAVALWPLPVATGAIGHPTGDLVDHYWGTWWFGRELLAGRWPDTTDLTRFPEHLHFWYADPLGALLALPLRGLGFPATWNALVYVQALAAATAAYALAARWTRRRSAGLVAGVVVASSPYLLGLVHSGLSEYVGLSFPVLATGALAWATGQLGEPPQGHRPAVLAGLAMGLCAWQAAYYFVFAVLLAACMLPGRGWRGRVRALLIATLVGTGVAAPALWAHLSGVGDGSAVSQANAPGWNFATLPATDLLTFLHPGRYYFPDTPKLGNPGILQVNYLGWVVVGLAIAGATRARRLARVTALYGLFALGPTLCVGRRILRIAGHPIPLPLALLYLPGSPFRYVHHPYRLVAFLVPLLALLAARGALLLPAGARLAAAGAILVEGLMVSPVQWPLPVTPTAPPAIYAELASGPVLDWPADASTWNRRYLLWQVTHHRPIPYGVNVFLPKKLRQDPLVAGLIERLDDLRRRARNRDVPYRGRLVLPPNRGPSQLGRLGFRWLIVHPPALSQGEWTRTRTWLIERLGDPVVQEDDAVAWDLQSP